MLFKNDTQVAIVSFTVDPARDSATKLKQYMQHFNIPALQWNFLTGDKKEIYRLARESYNVSASDGDGGPEDFIHSDKLVLIDRQKTNSRVLYRHRCKSHIAIN